MKYAWLSHVIDTETPLYGGQKDGIRIEADKSIAAGDSCNTSLIRMPAHTGTHVDAPRHFVADGLAVDGLGAESWVFQHPVVVKVPASPGQIIQPADFMEQVPEKMDACFFKTGFEQHRQSDVYWEEGPGIAPETAGFLKDRFPGLKAIGMDFISISSLTDRDTGRQAHRAFLEKKILIIEDMKLGEIAEGRALTEVVCLPLRFVNGDGAPCTILGILAENVEGNNAI